jgi:hypothetical protein
MKYFIIFTAILAVAVALAAAADEADNYMPIEFILQNPDGNCVTEIDLPGFKNLEGLEPVNPTNWLLVYAQNEPPQFVNKAALEGT